MISGKNHVEHNAITVLRINYRERADKPVAKFLQPLLERKCFLIVLHVEKLSPVWTPPPLLDVLQTFRSRSSNKSAIEPGDGKEVKEFNLIASAPVSGQRFNGRPFAFECSLVKQ